MSTSPANVTVDEGLRDTRGHRTVRRWGMVLTVIVALAATFASLTLVATGCDEPDSITYPNCVAWEDGGPFQYSARFLVILPPLVLMIGATVLAVRRRQLRWLAAGFVIAGAFLAHLMDRGYPYFPRFW